MDSSVINLTYLTASVLFILGIKGLTHPRTAVRGNLYGATGMLLAIIATLATRDVFGSGLQGIGVSSLASSSVVGSAPRSR